jgi:4-amino-4-deoxy-L-arabinose transferase-like glycosyltransferase
MAELAQFTVAARPCGDFRLSAPFFVYRMIHPMFARFPALKTRLVWYALAVVLAVFTYFYGLGSQQIPKNSDEYLYIHIARMTAASGHWLPLQSELATMRNIKPPMMFWHAILSTDWGKQWDLWHLRYPSVIYTLLTSLLILVLTRRLTGKAETALVAMLTYLAFFTTYRFGRPYLTEPGTVFWLFLPFFTLLYWRPQAFQSRFWFPMGLGLVTGIGLLYKSFFFLLPVGLALLWWYLQQRRYHWREFLKHDLWRAAVLGAVSLAVFFGLWIGLDPHPAALWHEFFWVENVAKVDQSNYLGKMLWGEHSIWWLLLGYPINATFLALPVFGVAWLAWRNRKQATDNEKFLWILLASYLFMFSLASQRSSRYMLEAMPALAILCALYWDRINRWLFVGGLAMAAVMLALMLRLSLRLQDEMGGHLYGWEFWVLMAVVTALLLVAVFVPRLTRVTFNVVVIAGFLCFAAFVAPFDGPPGNYSAQAQQFARGKEVWVPCNKFIAKDEGHRFLLPGADVYGYYDHLPGRTPEWLAHRYRYFAVRLPMQQGQPCADCKVIGERIEIAGRQYWPEIEQMLFKGEVFQHLFVREWLVESTVPTVSSAGTKPVSECR